MNTSPDATEDSTPSAGQARRSLTLLLGLLMAVVIGAAAAIAALRARLNDGVPELTEEAIASAEACWEATAPAGYKLRVRIEGRRPGDVECTVEGGEVTSMTRDGRTPSQRRTWDYWTVPAQFDTIRQDMASAVEPQAGFGAPAGSKVLLRAEFDSQYGYPKRYRRYVLGTPLEVEWEIVEFQPFAAERGPTDAAPD